MVVTCHSIHFLKRCLEYLHLEGNVSVTIEVGIPPYFLNAMHVFIFQPISDVVVFVYVERSFQESGFFSILEGQRLPVAFGLSEVSDETLRVETVILIECANKMSPI